MLNTYTHQIDSQLDLLLERTVDVPRQLVWRAWTTPEHLKKWFTPAPWKTVGCEIDLRQASIAPGTEAVIDVFAFWGGIEIKVPEDWTVVTRAVPLMGGVEDKTHVPQPLPAVEKRLVISGIVVMGGVVVKN